MKTIKIYLNSAEASFASSLLEAGGIRTLLNGEHSFGLTPGFASGGIRLQVADEDFEKALIILREGFDAAEKASGSAEEASRGEASAGDVPPEMFEDVPPEAFEAEAPASSADTGDGKIPVGVFVAAVAVLAFLSFVLYQRSERERAAPVSQTQSRDLDGDGTADCFYIYRYGALQREEIDRNRDRAVDQWNFFDSAGLVERGEADDNFDGRPDVWTAYRNGLVESWKRDVDFDGVPDLFGVCEHGQAVQSESRPGDSKIVVRRYFFKNDAVREELVDENRDGKFDYRIQWDPFGTPSERMPIDGAKER